MTITITFFTILILIFSVSNCCSSGFYHDPNAGWYYSSRDGLYYKFENGNYVLLESYKVTPLLDFFF